MATGQNGRAKWRAGAAVSCGKSRSKRPDNRPTDRTKATGHRPDKIAPLLPIHAQDRPTDRTKATDRTPGQNEDFAACYVARLESENDFLRRALEAAQQSEAVTKAALREALKIAPRQLSEMLAQGTPDSSTNGANNNTSAPKSKPRGQPQGDEIEAQNKHGGEEISPDELLDLCRRISR